MQEAKHYFTAQQVVMATGISERRLHYWDSAGVVHPSKRGGGAGVYRGYSLDEVVLISIAKRMRDAGISLHRVRKAMPAIRKTVSVARGAGRTPRLVVDGEHALLIVDGDAASAQELVVDALNGGQLVLALPVASVREAVQATLADPRWHPRRTSLAAQ
jgi:DNA-binding transcriptional MerR regulator